MRIVIIEDDLAKSAQIAAFAKERFPYAELKETHSYQSGLREVVDNRADLIVLDMTLPTYDIAGGEAGGRIRTFGGIDILSEIQRRELPVIAIVVTQFESFGEGHEKRTLDELTAELKADYSGIYAGTVYYHPAQADWRPRLTALLNKVCNSPKERS
jgi:CheY-like chemotaxis protein